MKMLAGLKKRRISGADNAISYRCGNGFENKLRVDAEKIIELIKHHVILSVPFQF